MKIETRYNLKEIDIIYPMIKERQQMLNTLDEVHELTIDILRRTKTYKNENIPEKFKTMLNSISISANRINEQLVELNRFYKF